MSRHPRRWIDRQQTPNTEEDEARNRMELAERPPGSSEMLERVSRAYWNAGLQVSRWDVESEEQRALVRHRMRAAIAAMREPSEAMWSGLARDLVLWNRGGPPPWGQTGESLYRQLRMIGRPIPPWLLAEIPDNDHVPPKGTVAACIFKAMIDAALPETP